MGFSSQRQPRCQPGRTQGRPYTHGFSRSVKGETWDQALWFLRALPLGVGRRWQGPSSAFVCKVFLQRRAFCTSGAALRCGFV